MKLSLNSRLGFIRKVYSILLIQLVITALFVVAGASSEGFRDFIKRNIGLYVIAVIGYIACVLLLFCVKSLSVKVPINYILLIILTLCMSYTTYMKISLMNDLLE